MPNILVKIPRGAFPDAAQAQLLRHITDAAATVEQIPAVPARRATIWVAIEQIDTGAFSCGGIDLTAQLLPCIALVHVPAGVLDDGSRALYVKLMHEAFERALPVEDRRKLLTSVILHEVRDGTWGGSGIIWTLPDFAMAAGYAHLQPNPVPLHADKPQPA